MTEAKEKIESFLNDGKVWSFNVKFNTTKENWKAFEDFKSLCQAESGDSYLLGSRKLMDYYKSDFKYASLFDLIEVLRADMLDLSTKIDSNVKPEIINSGKTFGQV